MKLFIHKRTEDASAAPPSPREASIDRALDLLRQATPPSGFKERLQARLKTADVDEKRDAFFPRYTMRIAASVVAVALVSAGMVVHFSRGPAPVAPMPSAAHHAASPGMEAAGAIRVPTHAIGPTKLSGGRNAHLRSSGRGVGARHGLLPRGVAVPQHPASPGPDQAPTANDSKAP